MFAESQCNCKIRKDPKFLLICCLKLSNIDTCCRMDETWKHGAHWKRQGCVLYSSVYVKWPELASPQGQKVGKRLPRALGPRKGKEAIDSLVQVFSVKWWKCTKLVVMLPNSVDMLKNDPSCVLSMDELCSVWTASQQSYSFKHSSATSHCDCWRAQMFPARKEGALKGNECAGVWLL